MSLANKIVIGSVVGAGVYVAVAYFKDLKRAQAELQVVPSVSIHKLDLGGLTVRVDALLKNPTGASFKIKYPLIELSHNNTLVGSSQSVNKDITIPAYGQVIIKGIMVEIPVISFFSVMADIVKALMNKQPIAFTVDIITTLDLGWTQQAYEHKQDVTLKK